MRSATTGVVRVRNRSGILSRVRNQQLKQLENNSKKHKRTPPLTSPYIPHNLTLKGRTPFECYTLSMCNLIYQRFSALVNSPLNSSAPMRNPVPLRVAGHSPISNRSSRYFLLVKGSLHNTPKHDILNWGVIDHRLCLRRR